MKIIRQLFFIILFLFSILFYNSCNIFEPNGENFSTSDLDIRDMISINEIHWVMHFESLAEEDDWAAKIVQDEVYLNWFIKAEGVLTPGVDRLYRDAPMMN